MRDVSEIRMGQVRYTEVMTLLNKLQLLTE